MIPESSLPMGAAAGGMDTEPGVHIQSAHPSSTTADLAGAQPIIPRSERQVTSIHPSSDTDVAPGVPEVVKESQHAAGQGPEAAGSAEAVAEKSMVEKELTQHVTPAAVTSDEKVHESKPSGVAGMLGMGAAGAGIGGAVAAGVAALTGSKSPQTGSSKEPEQAASTKPMSSVPEPKSSVPEPMSSVPEPVSSVPEPVKESMHEAHASPEAASSAEAVAEKAKVEEELTRRVTPAAVTSDEKVHESKPSGVAGMLGMGAAGAGIGGAVAAGVAALTGSKSQPTGSAKEPSKMASTEPVSSVPEAVKESMHEAHASPEAAANPVAVKEKKAVESELLSEIPREQSTGASAPSMAAVSSKSTPTAADVLTSTEKSTTMGSPKSELGTSQSSGGVGALFTPSVPSKDGYLGSDYAKKDVTAPVKTTDTPMFSNTAPIAPSTALPVAATSAGNSGATAAAASSGLAGPVSSQAMASQFTAGPESVTKQATTMGDDAINQTTAALPSRGKGAAAAPIDTEKAAPSTPTAARSGLLSPMNNSSNLATPASPALSETPSSSLGGESSTAKADRKSKRHSIFNRIKDKLSHH